MRDLDRASGQLLLRAEERWPDSVLLKVLLGEHYKNATTGASPDEDLARARGLLEQALAADPSLLRAELLIGQMDVAAGRLAEAAERAARVLAAAPGDPDALLLEHRAAVRRGWGVEAEAALSAARSVAPGRLDLLDAAIDFYEASGAIEKLASARLERARRTPGHEDRAELLARAGRTGEAVALWRGMLELRPTYIYGWIGLVRTLVDAERYDDALVALDEAEQAFPQEPWIPFQRAGVLRLQGREDAARAALARTVALEPGRIALRALLDEQAGSLDMERWLVDVDALLAEAAAPPAGVDSALLADIAVVLLDREGGQTELYQGVNGVFTRAGVEREGELELQPGARLEKVRIHKEDGREVDVVLGDLPSLSLPGLEPGDAVEYVWRRYIPPGLLPGALDNRSIFLFQGPDRQYELSRYVVMHDPSIEVQVCGNEEGLRREVTTENGLTIRSWTAESMRQIKLEPHVPNQLEIVPHVRLGMGMSWPDVGDLVRSAVAGMLHPDPPLPGLAEDVRRRAASSAPRDLARSLHEVVNERLEPGGTALRLGLPASASASAGEGNRIGVALALAESLGLRPRLLFTRPLALRGRDLDCPTPGLFSYVLVEIPADEGPIYLDYNDVDHPFDRMPLEIGGSDGLRVPLDPAETATVVDVPYRAPGVLERVDADLALEADGTFAGTLTVAARGSRAAVLRKVLRELPEDRIELAYESVVTRTFPGAEVLATRVEGLEEGDDEVRLRFGFEKGHWGRRTATGFALPMVHHPLPILSEYASLPTRRYPLLFDLADFRHDRIRIQLPAGMRLGDLPEGLQEENAFGRYSVSATLDDAGALLLERTAALPPRRIETDQYPAFRDFARRVEQAEAREVPVSVASPSLAPPG
jgi:tetratricopeptide (TPR) repeat protein